MRRSGRYEPHLITLATSMRDSASVKLLDPRTWLRGPQIMHGHEEHEPYTHIGAVLTELEFQRYQPRPVLTELLERYDLVQIVAGTPAWAWVACQVRRPICLFTATMARHERVALLKQSQLWRRYWVGAMTHRVEKIEQEALGSVACVFAESKYTMELVRPFLRPEQLHLAIPGVDITQFYADGYCVDGDILAVGRFADPRKNIRLLFDAYHLLRQRLPSAPKLVLAGRTAPSPHDIAYANSLGIAEYLQIHSNVSIERLGVLYRRAGLFVLPSDEEGLGMVILEAMASGVPVVSTDCGGPSTVVCDGETGVLTPVGNAEALAGAMLHLLLQPDLRRRMAQAARRRVVTSFSLEAAGQIYLQRYDVLLNGRGS
jgi:D-inositol-3-phosphate glycosyltransferase